MKEEIIKGILEKLYEEKSFTIPNGGDIPKVEITYEDWVWIEQFLAKEITDLLKAQNQDLLEKIEKKILELLPKCKHNIFLKNNMIFNGFIKDLDKKQVQICRFDEFEFADKIHKALEDINPLIK